MNTSKHKQETIESDSRSHKNGLRKKVIAGVAAVAIGGTGAAGAAKLNNLEKQVHSLQYDQSRSTATLMQDESQLGKLQTKLQSIESSGADMAQQELLAAESARSQAEMYTQALASIIESKGGDGSITMPITTCTAGAN